MAEAELHDVTTSDDRGFRRLSTKEPESEMVVVEPKSLQVIVGDLKITQKHGDQIPWDLGIEIDGVAQRFVKKITLVVDFEGMVTATIERLVL